MRVLLLQLDGKLPNLALMRIAHHHHEKGDYVELRRCGNLQSLEPRFEDRLFGNGDGVSRLGDVGFGAVAVSNPTGWDKVYGSLIFKSSLPLAERAMELYPHIDLGGTGWMLGRDLDAVGIDPDGPYRKGYQYYPKFTASIGFTQRGCRLSCEFCVVPKKEGKVRPTSTIFNIARFTHSEDDLIHTIVRRERVFGILLLDNDFFGNPQWAERIDELKTGYPVNSQRGVIYLPYKVSFNQGINARALNKETAQAIASVDYRDDSFKTKRIYTAWDNIGHEKPLFRGLEALCAAGVKPDHIMVYMLIGFGDSHEDRETRRRKLREFGARPYPMPYVRTPELVGFQRWVIGSYDKPSEKLGGKPVATWEQWMAAKCEPRKLGDRRVTLPLFKETEE
jgi:hypothetical protein